ncbi:hypothetical protein FC34_GL001271 [Lacticaseibacillus brantae DSM 23927]|uniref:Core domain-containing protein n=2 Tax=Lacticaseibacillus brantae TaxID=943673 RepID=A0A0R2AX63_9LACO|nr:hypothetical protein FC34_GL001271 [Lacticaseibacillus brantae DSM 23927]
MMEINVRDAAKEYLDKKVAPDRHIFLALDDGSSKFSKLGGSCAIGNKFQLVVSNAADAEYSLPLDNNANLDLTTAQPETLYLGHGLTLDFKNASLVLRDDSGILDGAVMIDEYTAPTKEDQALREEMKALGGKIC